MLPTLIVVLAAATLSLSDGLHAARACEDCPDAQTISPGSFYMGATADDPAASPDERPVHRVTISYPYEIGTTAVTRGQFAAFVTETGYTVAPGCWSLGDEGWQENASATWRAPGFSQTDSHPVVCVSRKDALAFLGWLSIKTGRPYRLPTEAEWEYAARGEGPQPFWAKPETVCVYGNVNDLTSKNKVAKVAEPCTDGYLFTSPAARFERNPNGLYDMIGNVWEWTADCAAEDYGRVPDDGSAWATEGCQAYVLRGHSWTDAPGPVRLETRYALPEGARQSIVGFRIAISSDR